MFAGTYRSWQSFVNPDIDLGTLAQLARKSIRKTSAIAGELQGGKSAAQQNLRRGNGQKGPTDDARQVEETVDTRKPTEERTAASELRVAEEAPASTQKERNPDTISVLSQCSTSAISLLPISQHSLTRRSHVPDSRNLSCLSLPRTSSRNSQRPNSYSQPIKASSLAPDPELINSASMAQLVGARSSSQPPLRTVVPMSTPSIQRYDRNYIVYGVLGHNSLSSHLADLCYTVLQNSHLSWSIP
jgi:hypothetical protein